MGTNRTVSAITGCCAVALAGVLAGCGSGGVEEGQAQQSSLVRTIVASTPSGITLVNVEREIETSQPEYLWTRLGDAKGATLFISDGDTRPGVSSCTGDCAVEFPPVLAPARASGFGDWSVLTRKDGTHQWAYLGKPLYTFSKETKFNEVVDNLVEEESKKSKLSQERDGDDGKPKLMPPKGWSVARYDPVPRFTRPNEIGVREVAVEDGIGPSLVNAQGMTLYGYDGSPDAAMRAECVGSDSQGACESRYKPALAAAAAVSRVGDFTVITRKEDQSRQWAYRGVPLYTFSADNKPEDTLGVYGDETGHWHVVMLSMDEFPKDVQRIYSVGRGIVLADLRGMPLYMRGRYEDRWGGFNTYQGYSNAYRMGKILGTRGCTTECEKLRQPLLASADDASHGYWEVLDRPDGRKQWAYKGFALYKYLPDKPGIVTGNNVLDYVIANESPYTLVIAREGEPPHSKNKAAGLYWYVARP